MTNRSRSQTEKDSIGARIKRLRRQKNWTQQDLASAFGVSKGTISLWEHGEMSIHGSALKLLELYEKNKVK